MSRIRMTLWFAGVWAFLVITYPSIFLARYFHYKSKFAKRDIYANKFVLRLCKFMFFLSRSKLTLTGLENVPQDRAVVFASNHQGHMDSIIIQGFINKTKGFISTKEFESVPIFGTWMKYMGCVFIDRSDARQSLLCMNEAKKKLDEGLSMVVYPEGRYNNGEETLKFEKGWLRMAIKSGSPIVPISISNTYKIISYNGKRMGSTNVQCIISKPIETAHLKREDEKQFLLDLRNLIAGKLCI